MSLSDCIRRAIDAKLISKSRAEKAQSFYQERRRAYGGGPDAEQAAAQDTWVHLRREHLRRKRGNLMQMKTNLRNVKYVTEYRDAAGVANASRAPMALLEHEGASKFMSVSGVRAALTAQYRRSIGDLIEKHKRNIVGSVRKAGELADVVRELHGEATGNAAAKELADAISRTLEMARLDFNGAGGSIGKLEDFGLPHSWDAEKMRKQGFDAWSAAIDKDLDWDRMIDLDSDKSFATSTPARRAQFLREVYDNITTDGWSKREPSGVQLGRSVGNRRGDHRVLHFRGADAWMRTNQAYGRSDPFTTIVTHLDGMARDTAQMRVLGPNPQAGLEFAIQTADKLAHERPWKPARIAAIGPRHGSATEEITARAAHARRMLDIESGVASSPEIGVVASGLSGLRHVLVASQLGGAMLSAVTDGGFMALAANHVGIRPEKVMGRHIRALASTKERALMVRAGIIADSAANVGVAQARLFGESYGPAVTERMSEFTMRASGLTAWTDIARGTFRLEFYGLLADNAGRSWADLDDPLRRLVFEKRGITEADWDDIRATVLHRDAAEPDATFLIPGDIRHRTDIDADRALDLSLRLEAAVFEQVEFAVPSASLRGRAMMEGGPPGSLAGELMRSGLMYKNFTMSLMYNQLGRVLFHQVRGSRASAIVAFATVTTIAGAISLQMKDMAKGYDPRDMTTGDFLKAAMLQGGGAGIFGDFLYATESRFGGGLATTVAGPMIGFADDVAKLTGAGIAYAIPGNETDGATDGDKLARRTVNFLNRNGGPTNLWYANLALDRMLWDNLQEFFDGDAQAAFRRREAQHRRDYGTGSYWPQGQPPSAARLPDLSSVLGGAEQ